MSSHEKGCLINVNYYYCYFSLKFTVKKEGWGGGGHREVKFMRGHTEVATLKASSKTLTVSIAPGLPRDSSECQHLSAFSSIKFNAVQDPHV